MRATCVRKRYNRQFAGMFDPFTMIKCITCRSSNRLNQFARTICHKNPFMRSVFFAGKITPGLAAKIKEQGSLGAIRRKRGIARLFFVVPDCARFAHSCAKEPSTCYRQRAVFAQAAMIRAIKQFLRCSEFSIRKSHLPCRGRLEIRLILVVSGIAHIYDCGVAIFKHSPTRYRRTLDIKLYKVRALSIQVANVKRRFASNPFKPSAERHLLTIRRNFRMVSIQSVSDFNH